MSYSSNSSGSAFKNWYPEITDLAAARGAAMQGVWAAVISAVLTGAFALYSLTGNQVLNIGPFALIDAALFALVAWLIHRMSRAGAIAGLVLYLAEKVSGLVNALNDPVSSRHTASIIVFGAFVLCYVNAIRGTFGYHVLLENGEPAVAVNDPFGPADKLPYDRTTRVGTLDSIAPAPKSDGGNPVPIAKPASASPPTPVAPRKVNSDASGPRW